MFRTAASAATASNSAIAEILAWHQSRHANDTKGSPLKLGVLSGCHDDMSCGDSLQTYSSHGWAYGLLQADLVEPFLLQYYAVSSHACAPPSSQSISDSCSTLSHPLLLTRMRLTYILES